MKIVVAYKWASDPQDATVNTDATLTWSNRREISEYEAVAFSIGRILADASNGELIGLTVGDKTASSPKATQAATSRKLDKLVVVADDELRDATPKQYAQLLAEAITKIGEVDLILTGDASLDVGASVIPALVAGKLKMPILSNVAKLELTNNKLQITHEYAKNEQVLRLSTPAVIAVNPDIAPLPLIGMKDMMAGRKKPVEVYTLADFSPLPESNLQLIKREIPTRKTRQQEIVTTAQELAEILRSKGVLE